MAKEKEHIIWQDEDLNLDDWRDDLLEEEPDLTESELYDRMVERNAEQLGDERMNLSGIQLDTPILVVAQLGLWHGVKPGYRLVESGKVTDCLETREQGSAAWYVDERGNFRARVHHHDGTNHYLYRGVKPGVSERTLDALCNKIFEGEEYEAMLNRLTYRLGDLIGDVYGWQFPNRPNITK